MKHLFYFFTFIFAFYNISSAQDTLSFNDFEDETLGTWSEISVIGDQNWYVSSFNANKFAYINGYSSGNVANEDWLISPQINFTDNAPVSFSFKSATTYTGDNIQVLVSTNYDGFSNPNTATWTNLSASLSTGSYVWVESGNINLSSYTGNGYVAIKYTSSTSAARVWEVDDLFISGSQGTVEPPVNSGSDTVTVMHYNLLAYTSSTYITCNQTNNNITTKDGYLKTILQYVKPDIFEVNEISDNSSDHDRLKTNCLNVDGITYYKRAVMTNNTTSWIVNELYYNSEKFELVMQDVILNDLRDINVYKLKYTTNDVDGNPIYLYCISAHLKAGETETVARAEMTSSIMTYLDNLGAAGNYIIMGDFNLYTSTETAYQNMISHTNSDTKMNDPVNKPGDWDNNSSFAYYHTQSTRYDFDGDTECFTEECGSGCGSDGRFDFILASNSIMNGDMKVSYISNSYKTIGQDGLHFNEAITDSPTNTSVPSNLITALYNGSDHYPVTLKLFIEADTSSSIADKVNTNTTNIFAMPNPASSSVNFVLSDVAKDSKISIYNTQGQVIDILNVQNGQSSINFNISNYENGIYFYSLENESAKITKRFIVVK